MELLEPLRTAIDAAGRSFAEGELAFLALTSKVERPLLDRISYKLHLALQSSGLIVAREHRVAPGVQADIAVLKEGVPLMALEAKAMYTADCTRRNGFYREYPDLLDADLKRYVAAGIEGLRVYSLLFGTHLLAPPPPGLKRVVKYAPMLSKAFNPNRTAEQIGAIAEQNLGTFLRSDLRRASGKARGGSAFGLELEVLWWMYGPFSGHEGWTILRTGTAEPPST